MATTARAPSAPGSAKVTAAVPTAVARKARVLMERCEIRGMPWVICNT